ncbi:MAG TPA: TIGR02281 family clan AA aspartic protease [Burkholderiaceae bacterium]|nr:TIGR02281 family clan AA aspartic protease [Burkholderiaceae bacterium]
MRALVAVLLLAIAAHATAQNAAKNVSLSGSFGDKAVLVIDGVPRTLAVGAIAQGVKLVSVGSGGAVVEIGGQRVTLAIGGTPVDLGGKRSDGSGTTVVVTADGGGHFVTTGSINGRAVTFLVDTGATYVSMGAAQARDLGVDVTKGQRGTSSTANGRIDIYKVRLDALRVGDVQLYDIDALVSEQPMPAVLLGNSALMRFQMRRDNDTLTLTKRY